MAHAILDIAHLRRSTIEIVQANILRVIDRGEARRLARVHQVARDFGLAIDGDRLAARCRCQIEAMPRPAEAKLDAAMHQPFAMQALRHAGLFEKPDGALF